jgi:hypothetical protein
VVAVAAAALVRLVLAAAAVGQLRQAAVLLRPKFFRLSLAAAV